MGAAQSREEQLHLACSKGDVETVDKLIKQYESDVKNGSKDTLNINTTINSTTCLYKALESRNFGIIKTLLNCYRLKLSYTNPAFYSLQKKDKELFKFILETREQCLYERNLQKEGLLEFIMNNEYEEEFADIVISLMDPHEFTMFQHDPNEKLLLHRICDKNDVGIFKLLLKKKGVNLQAIDKTTGDTALIRLIRNQQIEMIKQLIQHVEVVASNYENETPLHVAASIGNEEICKLLLDAENGKLLLNAKDCKLKTPLQNAIESNNFHLFSMLSKILDEDDAKMILEMSKSNSKLQDEIKLDSMLKDPSFTLQIASDIHLEFYDDKKPLDHIINPSAPYLCLLGDIGLPIRKQNYRNFLYDMAEKFKLVFVIAGNHEYYHSSKKEIEDEMKEIAKKKDNIIYLENSTYTLHDVKIIGCVLWSKCSPENEGFLLQINDYKCIAIEPKSEEKIKVEDTLKWHEESLEFIKKEIEESKKSNQKCIILTHHAPLKNLGSSEPSYYGSGLNEGFCTDLRYLMGDPILLWAYGHTHWPQDIKINGTRIVSNPSGYNLECKSYQPNNSIPIYK